MSQEEVEFLTVVLNHFKGVDRALMHSWQRDAYDRAMELSSLRLRAIQDRLTKIYGAEPQGKASVT